MELATTRGNRASGAMTNYKDSAIEKPLDMVMARRLEDFKSTVTEPYWKRIGREPPKVTNDIARVKKKAAALGKDFQVLLQAHERQEKLASDLRDRVRHLRQEAENKEKQVALAYRTIERLAVDKNNLEANAAEDKAHIRKLENRLVALRGVTELENHCNEQETNLQNLRVQLLEAQEAAAVAQEQAEQQRMDLVFMRRGLELAAEQLTRASGAEISSQMLLAVAKGNEEAGTFAHQLQQLTDHNNQLTAALEAAKTHLEAQHDALLQWQEADANLRGQLAELEAAYQEECNKTSRLLREAELLRPTAAAAKSARDGYRQEVELERTKLMELEGAVEKLLKSGRTKDTELASARAELQRLKQELKDEQRKVAEQAAVIQHHSALLGSGAMVLRKGGGGSSPHSATRGSSRPVGGARALTRQNQINNSGNGVRFQGFDSHSPQPRVQQQQQRTRNGRSPASPTSQQGTPPQVRRQAPQENSSSSSKPPAQHGLMDHSANSRSSLDDHIAMLEGQLADLSATAVVQHLQETAKAAAQRRSVTGTGAGGRQRGGQPQMQQRLNSGGDEVVDADVPLAMDVSPVSRSSRLSSPNKKGPLRYNSQDRHPAPEIWHSNPLASEDNNQPQNPNAATNADLDDDATMTAIDVQPISKTNARVITAANTSQQQQHRHNNNNTFDMTSFATTDDHAWELLQQQLDNNKSMDVRANQYWNDEQYVGIGGRNHNEGSGAVAGAGRQQQQRQLEKGDVDVDHSVSMSAISSNANTISTTTMPTQPPAQTQHQPPPPAVVNPNRKSQRPAMHIDVNAVPATPGTEGYDEAAARSPALSAVLRNNMRGSGGGDWLDGEYEPDIEQLEVKSAMKGGGGVKGRQTLFDLANMEFDL